MQDELLRRELEHDPTVDITTIGRRSGQPRRIEIWVMATDEGLFITGTPGRRDWLANLRANPELVVHLKRDAHVDLRATAVEVTDDSARRRVIEHLVSSWYRGQAPVEELVASAPMVQLTL